MKIKNIFLVAFAATGLCLGTWAGSAHNMVQLWEDGPYWADTNIGAETPEDYGCYFWWGDTIGYKRENGAWVASDGSSLNFSFSAGNASTYGKSIAALQREGWITADGVLAPMHDAAHVQWGGDWRMPTKQELVALTNNCDWSLTVTNGVSGYVVRGRGDYASASIFLPAAGYGKETSFVNPDSSFGDYWSSVPDPDDNNLSLSIAFDSSLYIADCFSRRAGRSVRPVQTPIKETTVTVGGSEVGEVVRGEDGKSFSFVVAAGTDAGDIKLAIGGNDVTKGFRVTVNGVAARAVLLTPYEVPKEEGAPNEMWTENGDGTVTINVTVVPGLYYAAASAVSLEALSCSGVAVPATGYTTLKVSKPAGGKGFFKVWVSDAPIAPTP